MISIRLFRALIGYACLMGITSFGMVWSIYIANSWWFGILLSLLLVLLIYALAHYLNTTNRKIAFFFEAIENEDTALIFPDVTKAPNLTALHRSLNKLNAIVQKVKMENLAQEQYYHKIFDQITTGILTKDERGFIYLANIACKKIVGRKHLTHVKQVKTFSTKLYHLIDQMQPNERQLVNLQVKGEPLHLLLNATGFRNQDHQLTIVTIQDIRNELDYKELDSWIKLIRVLTHEIINTISPMTSLSESIYERFLGQKIVLNKIELDKAIYEKTIEGLEVIKERGEGLIQFVDSYRRLTKLPKPKKTSLHLASLINKIKILVSSEPHFNQVIFSQKFIPEELEILADEKLIIQALINIIKNAIEALNDQDDGKIRIIASIETNGKVKIVITDNGPGVSPELLDDIFIPFFTTKTSGSGIGLTLSRQILRLHGGSLMIKTSPEHGASFEMIL